MHVNRWAYWKRLRNNSRHVKTRPNATELTTSVMQVEGGPQGFYERVGFELTGEYADRNKCLNQNPEALMRLVL